MHTEENPEQKGWNLEFGDQMTANWQTNWFLDGEHARITHSDDGMDFWAGSQAGDDACHAVLWTKQWFSGDLKIAYDFTRLDQAVRFVNIIYIQAEGSGAPGYGADIAHWSNLRSVPAMRMYFDHMHTYHISYAAFGMTNADPAADYIRARRYLPEMQNGLAETDLYPDYFETGLFAYGVKHKITIFKTDRELVMEIQNPDLGLKCRWDTSHLPPITTGRIGLRHMYTRGSRYHDFRVYCH